MARPAEFKRRAAILSSLVVWGWAPPAARADMTDAVNWARLHGCQSSATTRPLQTDSRLTAAASLLAAGRPLRQSLSESGYLADRSSVLHLSGAVGDADLRRALAARECGGVTDPMLTQIGALRRGRDVWLVLAAPVSLPAVRDAPSIGAQILALVNEARARGRRCGGRRFAGAAPLASDAALTRAATVHAEDMAAHGAFDHRGHDGSTPPARVSRAGFGAFSVVGENIAAGAMSPAEVVAGWLASAPHCENIMDPRFTAMGSGFAVNARSTELVYWTQDFAARRR